MYLFWLFPPNKAIGPLKRKRLLGGNANGKILEVTGIPIQDREQRITLYSCSKDQIEYVY